MTHRILGGFGGFRGFDPASRETKTGLYLYTYEGQPAGRKPQKPRNPRGNIGHRAIGARRGLRTSRDPSVAPSVAPSVRRPRAIGHRIGGRRADGICYWITSHQVKKILGTGVRITRIGVGIGVVVESHTAIGCCEENSGLRVRACGRPLRGRQFRT